MAILPLPSIPDTSELFMSKWFSCNESLFMLVDKESGEITANTDDDTLKNGLATKLCEYEFLSRKLGMAYSSTIDTNRKNVVFA
jgi:hypothetical protein